MSTKIEDTNLFCADCNTEFIWTVGQQEFMQSLKENGKLDRLSNDGVTMIEGQVTPPKRCDDCRGIRKSKYPTNR